MFQRPTPSGHKARRILNRLPQNLIDEGSQRALQATMTNTFMAQPEGRGYGTRSEITNRGNKYQDNSTMFDSGAHGFDLPASVQLQRVNYKITRWDRTQELIQHRQLEAEAKAKEFAKRDEKLQKKAEKGRATAIK